MSAQSTIVQSSARKRAGESMTLTTTKKIVMNLPSSSETSFDSSGLMDHKGEQEHPRKAGARPSAREGAPPIQGHRAEERAQGQEGDCLGGHVRREDRPERSRAQKDDHHERDERAESDARGSAGAAREGTG